MLEDVEEGATKRVRPTVVDECRRTCRGCTGSVSPNDFTESRQENFLDRDQNCLKFLAEY